ncbi:MAG: hypothetical protein JWO10_1995, partial [Microbacteriaceae bacterium]|nr:hypothetical protein [Microbacteriaceae bacterium]
SVRAQLEHYLRAEKVDVVHVQTEFGLAHAAADVARTIGIPVVHTVHTFYWASDGGPQSSIAGFLRWGLQTVTKGTIPQLALTARAADNVLRNLTLMMAVRADRVISPSAHQARDLQAAGVQTAIAVVPNPVATPVVTSVPLPAPQASEPTFLWVARCESVKRPLVFAQAAIQALERGARFSVDFVGDGAELSELKRLTDGHPQIRVRGAVDHDEVLRMMDASAAVVLTSLGFDNQPMTIAEAVSRQRGVLYCDPNLSEGLQNSGYLASTPDASGLADALVTLSAAPEPLLAMSEGARQDRELFAPAQFVERVLDVYAAAG